jgi:hypothetical protein
MNCRQRRGTAWEESKSSALTKANPMTPASGGWIIRRQVQCLIGEVLTDMTVDEARLGLLRHLAEYPGNPERALLAQVTDCKDREERKDSAQLREAGRDAETGRSTDAQSGPG